jgi:rRNA maturation protein Nop10
MKVYCTICCKEWRASKYTIKAGYVCPKCTTKMKKGIPIKLGRRDKYCKEMDKRRNRIFTR